MMTRAERLFVRELVGTTVVVAWALSLLWAPVLGGILDSIGPWHGDPGLLIGIIFPWAVLSLFLALKAEAVLPPPGRYYDTLSPPPNVDFGPLGVAWRTGVVVRAKSFYFRFWSELTIFCITCGVVAAITLGGIAAVTLTAYGLVPFGLTISVMRTIQWKRHAQSNLVRVAPTSRSDSHHERSGKKRSHRPQAHKKTK